MYRETDRIGLMRTLIIDRDVALPVQVQLNSMRICDAVDMLDMYATLNDVASIRLYIPPTACEPNPVNLWLFKDGTVSYGYTKE